VGESLLAALMAATMARPELEGNRRAGLFPRLLKTFIEVFTEVIHRCRCGDHRGTTIARAPITSAKCVPAGIPALAGSAPIRPMAL
jgi:hypothetical protein